MHMEVNGGGYGRPSLMATLHNIFSTTSLLVKRLMNCRQCGDDEEWAEQAIESLVKRLKKQRGALEDLERAVMNPHLPSKCVTIPRSLDGRIQISHKKGHPHVLYCKLWRWPDLQSYHELRPIDFCAHPFSARHNIICVNPYHYNRVDYPKMSPIVVPKNIAETPANVSPVENIRPAVSQNVTVSYPHNNMYARPEFTPQPIPFCDPIMNLSLCFDEQAMYAYDMFNTTAIAYVEPTYWASIAYYELNNRVGEIFNCAQPIVTVDGFTDPTQEAGRFCLGKLTNVHRNSSIENTRRHIGRGVQLHYAAGQVYLECYSEHAVFVQSKNCNFESDLHPTTVIKVPAGCFLKIFDYAHFNEILMRSAQFGFESVYELTKMCTIRVSFVKGWGAEYHRHDVTATPCWIEIHMNGALRWLDNVLIGMGAPYYDINSVS